MATDNFLKKKSILGLADRVSLCQAPDTIQFPSTLSWMYAGVGTNVYKAFTTVQTADLNLISNIDIIRDLIIGIGQQINCSIPYYDGDENSSSIIIPIICQKSIETVITGTMRIFEGCGVTSLNNGCLISGYIKYTYTKINNEAKAEKLECGTYYYSLM